MTRDELDQLMLLYAAGAADEAEAGEAEARLASGDPQAQAAYAEALAVVSALPKALPQQRPPVRSRDQLMLRVLASTSSEASSTPKSSSAAASRWIWPTWVAAGIAAVLAIALTLTLADNWRMKSDLITKSEIVDETYSVAGSPYVQMTKLRVGDAPDAPGKPAGRLVYCPVSDKYLLHVFRLDPPPPGKVYELWLISPNGKPIPAGTFTVDSRGAATHFFQAPKGADYSLAAITVEPEGGSLTPTGEIRLSGSLAAAIQ